MGARSQRWLHKRLPAYFPPAPPSCKGRSSRTQWHSMPRGGEGHTHSRLCAYSPDGATDYRRGQATRSPRSRDPQQITPPWGGAGVGQFIIHHSSFIIHHSSFIIHHSSFIIHHSSFIIHHSSFIIGSGVGGGWPGVTLRSPPSVICRPLGAWLSPGSAFARLGLTRVKHLLRADWEIILLQSSPNPSLMAFQFDSNATSI